MELYSIFCGNLYKNLKKEYIYAKLNHFVTHLKITEHCNSAVFQLN